MSRNPIILLPLIEVIREEIALPLQHIMHLYTVGSFLVAWKDPHTQRHIEHLFDSPEQARHAAATCAAWLGIAAPPTLTSVQAWWRDNDGSRISTPDQPTRHP